MRRLAILLGVWTGGCGGVSGPVVDHGRWEPVDAADDPLAAHRPDPVECGSTEWSVEDGALEVETAACNYLALGQPSLLRVVEGETP